MFEEWLFSCTVAVISLRKQREQSQQLSVTKMYLYLAPQKTQCTLPELWLKEKSADNYFYRWDNKVLDFNVVNQLQIEFLSLSVEADIANQRGKWRKYTCSSSNFALNKPSL